MFVPEISILASFLLVSFLVNITPGADMMFVVAQSLANGPKCGRFAALGIASGSVLHGGLAVVGISAVVAASPKMLAVLTYAGAAYLAWLGIRALRESGRTTSAEGQPRLTPTGAFCRGIVTNLLNPKVILFYLTFLPQFIQPAVGKEWKQVLFFALTFNFLGTLVLLAIAGCAGWLTSQLEGRQRWIDLMPKASGVIFIALAINLLRQA
ncbi:LysE family translocator [Actinokineospora iranica]|uniref:Threonine/homoserine/homoserine lactone efflux protein n=1 Tax=Actinokineospora iranica TaxID=1271860 RepID=A0A1G6SAE4_9PSEU|nr:LysE family translocator [Actinokineospora iranica]SDD13809.1 Threonine/homoserine/homoserine lactone efflux protein [Actinokineospora iranica]